VAMSATQGKGGGKDSMERRRLAASRGGLHAGECRFVIVGGKKEKPVLFIERERHCGTRFHLAGTDSGDKKESRPSSPIP